MQDNVHSHPAVSGIPWEGGCDMGEQKVLKRVVNHMAKNLVKGFTIPKHSYVCGVTLHPT